MRFADLNPKLPALAIALIIATFPASANTNELSKLTDFFDQFIKEHQIPGAAVAVTRDSKLMYAQGFGWADRENKQPVKPESLFRIASISKPITAVAIMQLVESGRIKLSDPFTQHLHSMTRYRSHPGFDRRIDKITIADLLRHSGGWDRGESFDPMGLTGHLRAARSLRKRPPLKPRDMISFMFQQPLQFDPGTRYAYSNFGYLLLGRIIEDTSGQAYENYVREKVLNPIGIISTQVGRMPREDRAPNEVRYYDHKQRVATAPFGPRRGQTVPNPYARPIQVMDAHGGWISSAVELARFAAAFDAPESSAVLKSKSIATMFDRPPGILGHDDNGNPTASYYALGWSVRPKGSGKANTWHTGSIQGTATLLVRRHDGFNWVVLLNTSRNAQGKSLGGIIDRQMHGVINSIDSWPTHDLFKSLR